MRVIASDSLLDYNQVTPGYSKLVGISLQQEFAKKTGISTKIPEPVRKGIADTGKQINKVESVQNPILLGLSEGMTGDLIPTPVQDTRNLLVIVGHP